MRFRCFFNVLGPFSVIFQLIFVVLTGISVLTCIFAAIISKVLAIFDFQWLFGQFFSSERLDPVRYNHHRHAFYASLGGFLPSVASSD